MLQRTMSNPSSVVPWHCESCCRQNFGAQTLSSILPRCSALRLAKSMVCGRSPVSKTRCVVEPLLLRSERQGFNRGRGGLFRLSAGIEMARALH